MKILNLILDGLLLALSCLFALFAIPPGLAAAALFMLCRATIGLQKREAA